MFYTTFDTGKIENLQILNHSNNKVSKKVVHTFFAQKRAENRRGRTPKHQHQKSIKSTTLSIHHNDLY